MMKIAIVLLLCVGIAMADRVFLEGEELHSVDGWQWVGAAPRDGQVRLTLMLKQRNMDQLDSIFWAVSTPSSPRYGQYLSMDELVELIAPEHEVVETVLAWLRVHGIREWSMPLTRDLITFTADVATAEKLLECKFWSFHYDNRIAAISSYGAYSVPEHIARHVAVVSGVTGFPLIPRTVQDIEEASRAAPNPTIGPADIRSAYGVPVGLVGKNATNSFAVAEFQGQFYSPTDLAEFFNRFNLPAATVAGVIGQNSPADPGVEASLDIEYIMGVAPGIPAYFYSQAAFNFWSDITTWLTTILSESKPVLIQSVSYGDQSFTGQPSVTYKNQVDAQFQKVGTLGISVVFASGDSGAGCHLCNQLSPSYPATSPYVTSVGATRFTDGVGSQEAAVQSFGSGGGFDWALSRPSYQNTAVTSYLSSKTLPPSRDFNSNGRATPDVAALGIGYTVISGGRAMSVGGTSASTPTFSAIIGLINDARLNVGKSSLGFLNPWIYSNPSMFTDIVIGNNAHSCCAGFTCVPGYDAVTGFGTPIFSSMLSSALSLQ